MAPCRPLQTTVKTKSVEPPLLLIQRYLYITHLRSHNVTCPFGGGRGRGCGSFTGWVLQLSRFQLFGTRSHSKGRVFER